MLAYVAALLVGPDWRPARASAGAGLLAALPLLLLVLLLAFGVMAACLAALSASPFAGLLHGLHILALAAAATCGCLLLAIPASAARPGLGWLLLAWLALGTGFAGLPGLALPHDDVVATGETAVLVLPFMVIGLGGAWATLPGGAWQTASGLGARWPAIMRCVLPAAWPAILRTCLVVFAVSAGVLARLI